MNCHYLIQKGSLFHTYLPTRLGLSSQNIIIKETEKCNVPADPLFFNSGSMRQGDHFSQTKKKSEKPVIDIIDFKQIRVMIRRKEIDSRFQKLNRMIGWRETGRAIFYK